MEVCRCCFVDGLNWLHNSERQLPRHPHRNRGPVRWFSNDRHIVIGTERLLHSPDSRHNQFVFEKILLISKIFDNQKLTLIKSLSCRWVKLNPSRWVSCSRILTSSCWPINMSLPYNFELWLVALNSCWASRTEMNGLRFKLPWSNRCNCGFEIKKVG